MFADLWDMLPYNLKEANKESLPKFCKGTKMDIVLFVVCILSVIVLNYFCSNISVKISIWCLRGNLKKLQPTFSEALWANWFETNNLIEHKPENTFNIPVVKLPSDKSSKRKDLAVQQDQPQEVKFPMPVIKPNKLSSRRPSLTSRRKILQLKQIKICQCHAARQSNWQQNSSNANKIQWKWKQWRENIE